MSETVPTPESEPIPSSPRVEWEAAGRSPVSAAVATRSARITSAIVAAASLALLTVAWILRPSADGLGTHQQLGLPPCGWIVAADLPCPTCGMTTSFSHAANGDLVSSFVAQPFGMLLALSTAVVVVVGAYTAVTGSMLAPFLAGMISPRVGWIAVALLIMAWAWKIVDHRELL